MDTGNWPTGPERQPVVAGQFYPADARTLQAQVRGYLDKAPQGEKLAPRLVMVPHAGYMYSGGVAGETLGRTELPNSLLLLGPNHTGLGPPLSLWNGGSWRIPGAEMRVDRELSQALVEGSPALAPDMAAHSQEHSLEVVLPFIHELAPKARFAALTVAEHGLKRLLSTARDIAAVFKERKEPVAMVVSSDMSHYLPQQLAQDKDSLALARIEGLDPEGLYQTVREHGITMCGVLPMTLGLAVCRELGCATAQLAAYATSGDASGDYGRVVGYAGALVL